MKGGRGKESVHSDTHRSSFDTEKLNRATERVAAGDEQFINTAIGLLQDLEFPAFKHKILEHAAKKTQDPEILGLFESLDGHITFKDSYHVWRAVQEHGEKYWHDRRISDETREHPDFNVRTAPPERSIKERQVASKEEERKDYPEISPTMTKSYICDRCGKSFLTRDDLIHHQRFEG